MPRLACSTLQLAFHQRAYVVDAQVTQLPEYPQKVGYEDEREGLYAGRFGLCVAKLYFISASWSS